MKKTRFFSKLLFTIFTFFSLSTLAHAKDMTAAVIYSMGGKFDKSFNESANRGLQRFEKETGIKVLDFEPTNPSQYEQAIRRLSNRADIVCVIGFDFITPLNRLAPEFPDTKFVIIDAPVDQPNVKSILFKEHEGSFLAGMAAALKTKTGKIGFVGGRDIPLIRKFQLGYVEGAHHIDEKIHVFKNMTGNTNAAWSDPAKGGELAKGQIDRGADVIYAAAGGTSIGILQAAADRNVFGIGVDSNQNYRHPGNMLTSMVKRVDEAIYQALVDFKNDQFTTGVVEVGLKENMIELAVDEYNDALITADIKTKLEEAKNAIIAGDIKVSDYTKLDNK